MHLADRFAEDAVRHAHRPLPARFLLLDAGHLPAVEIEGGGIVLIIQRSAGAIDHAAGDIVLQYLQIRLGEIVTEGLEERRLLDDKLLLIGNVANGKIGFPVESGIIRFEPGCAHCIVLRRDVTQPDFAPGMPRERIFDRQRVVRGIDGVVQVGKGEDLFEERPIAIFDGRVRRINVIVAIADPQSALSEVENLGVAVEEVRSYVASEEQVHAPVMKGCDLPYQTLSISHRIDLVQHFPEGGIALRIQFRGVESLLVQDYDLLVR